MTSGYCGLIFTIAKTKEQPEKIPSKVSISSTWSPWNASFKISNALTDKESAKHIVNQCAMIVQHQTNNTGSIRRSQPANEHNKRSGHRPTACWIQIDRNRHYNTRTNHAANKGDIANHNLIEIGNKIQQNAGNHWKNQPATCIIKSKRILMFCYINWAGEHMFKNLQISIFGRILSRQ